MKRGFVLRRHLALELALALVVLGGAIGPGMAQGTSAQCSDFQKYNKAAAEKATAVQAAMKTHADRKEICKLMTTFVAAEEKVIKFLIENKTWCGVPDQVIAQSKAAHEKSTHFKTVACSAGPAGPKAPTLSDAIKTTPLDTSSNVKTNRGGTFDTLTGNPLGR